MRIRDHPPSLFLELVHIWICLIDAEWINENSIISFPTQSRRSVQRLDRSTVSRTVACRLLFHQTGQTSHLKYLNLGRKAVPARRRRQHDGPWSDRRHPAERLLKPQHLPLSPSSPPHEPFKDRRRGIESLTLSTPLRTISFPTGLNPGLSTISERPIRAG